MSLLSRVSLLLLIGMPLLLVPLRAAQTVARPSLAQHPLDPLTAAEIETAAKVLGAVPQFPEGAQFATQDDPRRILFAEPGT